MLERWVGSVAGGEPFDMELMLRGRDGVSRPFLTRVEPVRGDDGRVAWWFGTHTDIGELKRAEAALREADRRKDEFLVTLAHELRNPLAPIRNALEILRRSADPQDQEQAHSVMQRQLGQIVRLVDDLLDVGRISMGKLELRKGPTPLRAVVHAAVETSRPLIEHMGHELAVVLPDEPMAVDADPARLGQVISNLLINSAKYTDRGGRIRLTAGRDGSEAVVSVRGQRHRHRPRQTRRPLRVVLAGGPFLGEGTGRAGDRADPGEAAGRVARRSHRGQERGAGEGLGVRRPIAARGGDRVARHSRAGRAACCEVVAPHPGGGRQPTTRPACSPGC